MAAIKVPVGPPYGTIPVNADAICAAIPDPALPAAASLLLIDSAGGRSINASVGIRDIGRMLGAGFAEFASVDQTGSICFVSRTAWISVAPHPQVQGVSQINFANRRPLAVAGSVDVVLAILEQASRENRTVSG
jgi:hypothetical protein